MNTSRMGAIACACLYAAIFFYLALQTRWADSELWAIGVAGATEVSAQPVAKFKVLFNTVLGIPYLFDLGNLESIQAARGMFALIGLASLGLVFLIARSISGGNKEALWSVFLVGTTTFYLSQGFKVRSDLLAMFFQLAALAHFLRSRGSTSRASILFGFLMHVAALLCTPKAIFHVLVNFVFVWSYWRRRGGDPNKAYLKGAFGAPVLLLALFGLYHWKGFVGAAGFFFEMYRESPYHPGYVSAESIRYVLAFVRQNFHLWVILLVMGMFRRSSSSMSERALGTASIAAIAFTLLHSDRLPFFIVSMVTIPVLWVALRSFAVLSTLRTPAPRAFAAAVAVVLLSISPYVYRLWTEGTNQLQKNALVVMDEYLASYPSVQYFDGTAVLPRSNRVYAFPTPERKNDVERFQPIIRNPETELVFFGNRMNYYARPLLTALEERHFIQIGRGVFARTFVTPVNQWSKLSADFLEEICNSLGKPEFLYVYQGSQMLAMAPLEGEEPFLKCDGSDLIKKIAQFRPTQDFVGLTRYRPLVFPEEMSFARLFDFDPNF